MLTITFFFLLIAEFIPTTSLMVPLIGKYLMAVMILVTLSVVVVVIIINLFFRNPLAHRPIPDWMDAVFMKWLPKQLRMERPVDTGDDDDEHPTSEELQSKNLVATEGQ
jgi:nicotinic acetylcholine receptor